MSSTTPSVPSDTGAFNSGNGGNDNRGSGPTSSPLLFFVALGFGVVFTNLWIIVGVKYCFRYNQRNRQARQLADGEQIDMTNMQPHRRRRREKKLMTMDEVNERFPLTKYKTWRAAREQEGLPAAGGIAGSRAASLKDAEGIIGKNSVETARPETAIAQAQQDHVAALSPTTTATEPATATATTTAPEASDPTPEVPTDVEKKDQKTAELREHFAPTRQITEHYGPNGEGQRDDSTVIDNDPNNKTSAPHATVEDDDEDDEDDPIRTAAPPEMLAAPGDTCAICLDGLEDDDDVRGLTCGHAFHAACVDPWLTGRRACCPLCKADYYVPKPRPEGEQPQQEEANNNGRRSAGIGGLRINMPGAPAQARYAGTSGFGRNRIVMFATGQTQERRSRGIQPDVAPATETAGNTGESTTTGGWRSRIPGLGSRNTTEPTTLPVDDPAQRPARSWPGWLSRRNRVAQSQEATPQEVTPSALEQGRR